MFTRIFLEKMRHKAFQRRIFFTSLDKLERGILNLSIRIKKRVKSEVLGKELLKIIVKIRAALTSEWKKNAETYGRFKARIRSNQAIAWGNTAAINWSSNEGFSRYLTMFYSAHVNISVCFQECRKLG